MESSCNITSINKLFDSVENTLKKEGKNDYKTVHILCFSPTYC